MTRRPNRTIAVIAVALTVAAWTLWVPPATAGDLDPPAGPIAATMKTLDQVEPRIPIDASPTPAALFQITQPGSYYLTGNRLCTAGGISISASDVTLDLGGYALVGLDTPPSDGIVILAGVNIEIRNGTVRDFGRFGIYGSTTSVREVRVLDVRVMSNINDGIHMEGVGGLIRSCTISENGNQGIATERAYSILDCNVRQNGGSGIGAGHGNSVVGNTVYFNEGHGIYTGNACTVSRNVILDNSGMYGIHVGTGSVVTNNAQHNSTIGIDVSNGGVVIGNTVSNNDQYGLYAHDSFVDQNAAFGNNMAGGFANMYTDPQCVVGQNYAP